MRVVVIPKNIVPLLKKRTVVSELEKLGEVKLSLRDQECTIDGEAGKDWIAEQVVKAIALGFAPDKAFKLFNDEYFLEILDLQLAFRRQEKGIERAKARVIGTEGKAKKILEELTGAYISVWDDKVAIIGKFEDLRLAKEGVTRILEGAIHTHVYEYLERMQRKRD